MNVKQLKKCIGWWARIRPKARGVSIDDPDWFIESVDESRGCVRLELPATGHCMELEGDHLHSFMKDPKRRFGNHCFLILRVELTIEDTHVYVEPCHPIAPEEANGDPRIAILIEATSRDQVCAPNSLTCDGLTQIVQTPFSPRDTRLYARKIAPIEYSTDSSGGDRSSSESGAHPQYDLLDSYIDARFRADRALRIRMYLSS